MMSNSSYPNQRYKKSLTPNLLRMDLYEGNLSVCFWYEYLTSKTLNCLVKNAAIITYYHSTSGCSWKATYPIQKRMNEVMMGWVSSLYWSHEDILFIFLLADFINLSFGITSIVVKVYDTPPIVQVRGCRNWGNRTRVR